MDVRCRQHRRPRSEWRTQVLCPGASISDSGRALLRSRDRGSAVVAARSAVCHPPSAVCRLPSHVRRRSGAQRSLPSAIPDRRTRARTVATRSDLGHRCCRHRTSIPGPTSDLRIPDRRSAIRYLSHEMVWNHERACSTPLPSAVSALLDHRCYRLRSHPSLIHGSVPLCHCPRRRRRPRGCSWAARLLRCARSDRRRDVPPA